jgi:hypothetical protein
MKKNLSLSVDECRAVLSCLKAPWGINLASLFYDWPDCGASQSQSFPVAVRRWYVPLRNLCKAHVLQAYHDLNPEPSVKMPQPDFRYRMYFRLTAIGRAVSSQVRETESMEPMPTLNHFVSTGKWEVETIPPRPTRAGRNRPGNGVMTSGCESRRGKV